MASNHPTTVRSTTNTSKASSSHTTFQLYSTAPERVTMPPARKLSEGPILIKNDIGTDKISCTLEIEFLVARAKVGGSPSPKPPKDSRWMCQYDSLNPVLDCLTQCAIVMRDVIANHKLPPRNVSVRGSPDTFDVSQAEPDTMPLDTELDDWSLSPSSHATSVSDSPANFDWVGVKLRSPPVDFVVKSPSIGDSSNLRPDLMSPINRMFWSLRSSILIHCNSTCQMRGRLLLPNRELQLIDAKKFLALCWLLEQAVLLQLRPSIASLHYRPITESSKLAALPSAVSKGVVGQAVMDAHIPELYDPELQDRIRQIWTASTLSELSDLIKARDGECTITLHLPQCSSCSLEFRYDLWHPLKETSSFWTQIMGRLLRISMWETARYKDFVATVNCKLCQIEKEGSSASWWTALTPLFYPILIRRWIEVLAEFESDGCMSAKKLDAQGVLEGLPEDPLPRPPITKNRDTFDADNLMSSYTWSDKPY